MNTVEVDSDNSSKDGNDQDNQNEEDNENEKDILQVVEFHDISSKSPKSKKCYKIILVIFISLIFLGAIFFIASKEVKTLYENSFSNNSMNTSNNLIAQNNDKINKIESNEKEKYNNNITTNNPDLNDKANEVKETKENNANPFEKNNNNVIQSHKIISKTNNINNPNNLLENKTNEIIVINNLKPIEDEEQERDIHFDFNETNNINIKSILYQSEMNSSIKVGEKENNETNIYSPNNTYIFNSSNKLNESNINKDIEQSIISSLAYSAHKFYGSDKILNENIENNSVINFTENFKENLTDSNDATNNGTKKIGLAFIYSSLFSNGIARFITVTANYFMKTGKYDIIFITGKPNRKEYSFDKRIKRYVGEDNFTIIKNITEHENIDFFILQNFLGPTTINFCKSLGKKVIGMFHGVYMSAMFHNEPLDYKNWLNFDLFDSFIFIAADDYYFYKNLGFKNEIYIPNLYTFEPKEIKESNLTSHNILMLGRLNDEIKGLKYAVKTLYYIVKEVPDAKLTLVTSDYRIEFAKNLAKDLNISKNLVINYHTYNISQHFWNSAVHMYTSLTEAFPMAMNEAKAHGLPIVAFDVPFSPPYQDGVITVDLLDCKGLARETIKLLKDFDYRKRMGEISKLSLNKYSNEETIEMWGKLFKSLLSEDRNDYREFQKEIEKKYYNEKIAKKHIEKHFDALLRYNKNFTCYTLDNFLDPEFIKNIKECTPNQKL